MTDYVSAAIIELVMRRWGTLLCEGGVAKDGVVDCDACKIEVYVVFPLDKLIGDVRNVVLSLD